MWQLCRCKDNIEWNAYVIVCMGVGVGGEGLLKNAILCSNAMNAYTSA